MFDVVYIVACVWSVGDVVGGVVLWVGGCCVWWRVSWCV